MSYVSQSTATLIIFRSFAPDFMPNLQSEGYEFGPHLTLTLSLIDTLLQTEEY